jgi:hypothetical protein
MTRLQKCYYHFIHTGIQRLGYPDTGTYTNLAIDWANSELTAKARPGVPRVIVVVTDGQSENPALTEQAAARAKNNGIEMYALGMCFGWFVGWFFGWCLVGWSLGWLVFWSVGWLVALLVCLLVCLLVIAMHARARVRVCVCVCVWACLCL